MGNPQVPWREYPVGPGWMPQGRLRPGPARHLGPFYVGYREARDLIAESRDMSANEAQNIIEDLAHWAPNVKRFSFTHPHYGLAWMYWSGSQFYWRNDRIGHDHEWAEGSVMCIDIHCKQLRHEPAHASHPAAICGCGEVVDLLFNDDPRSHP